MTRRAHPERAFREPRRFFGHASDNPRSPCAATAASRGLTLAVAEPPTGGLMPSRLGELDPAMAVFRGAMIGDRPLSQRISPPGDRRRMRTYSAIGVLNFLRKALSD
ncbi:MAG: hypothetical protein O7A03_11020 [Alphaproteobacteria bacterium]|nr:hypothetical protein [Alphaproteobacteria bacterium]